MKIPEAVKALFIAAGKAGGKLRWKGSTAEQRRAFAMKGVKARAKRRNGG